MTEQGRTITTKIEGTTIFQLEPTMSIKKTEAITLRCFAETVLKSIEDGGTKSDEELANLARQALGIDDEGRLISDAYLALMNLNDALFEASFSGALDVIEMETQGHDSITDFCDAVRVTIRDRLT